jgi:hypothetical protein
MHDPVPLVDIVANKLESFFLDLAADSRQTVYEE